MKIIKYLTVLAFTFGAIIHLHSQGFIVPNGVTYAGSATSLGAEIHVLQEPTGVKYTGFNLTPQGKTQPTIYTNTFLFNPFLDGGVRTFLVSSNDSISLQPIMANSYPELTYPNNYIFASGAPFYLGFYTGGNPYDANGNYTGIYNNPLFGWGRFVNNRGVIELLDSALEYGGGGIYAGTQTIIPVPEPGTLGLFALGGLLLAFRGLRR